MHMYQHPPESMGGSLNSAMAGAALSRDSAVKPAAATAAKDLVLSSRAALAARSANSTAWYRTMVKGAWQPNVPASALIVQGVSEDHRSRLHVS